MSAQHETAMAAWWHEVSHAALLGTARRGVPDPPELGVEVSPEGARRLLDQVALGAGLQHRRVPRRLSPPEPVELAAEQRSAAPDAAVHLLRLLLVDAPVSERLARELIVVWLRACDEDFSRVPGEVLPAVLDLALRAARVRAALQPVLGESGRRVCALNPAWQRALEPSTAGRASSYAAWQALPLAERTSAFEAERREDPAAGRAWLEACWADEPARARAALLPLLAYGLGPEDEPLAERALDDRAAGVREAAAWLLDGLPGSARAARAEAALTPLVGFSRRLRRRLLEVGDPPEPTAEDRRDGHARAAPRGVDPARARVRRLVAAAPLDCWQRLVDLTPEQVVAGADDDVLAGLVHGAVAEGSAAWAAPLLARVWEPRLLALLDPAARAQAAAAHLVSIVKTGDVAELHRLQETLNALPGRWPDALADPVAGALMHPQMRHDLVRELTPLLLERLPRTALGALERSRALRLSPMQVSALDDVRRGIEMRGSIARAFR